MMQAKTRFQTNYPFEEWEDFVWAVDESQAWKKCQFMANEAELTEVVNVTQESKQRNTNLI